MDCKGCDIAEEALAVCEICKGREKAEAENKRLRKLFKLHNLLPFIAKGKCRCDPDVGACPCESCAAAEILAALKEKEPE